MVRIAKLQFIKITLCCVGAQINTLVITNLELIMVVINQSGEYGKITIQASARKQTFVLTKG